LFLLTGCTVMFTQKTPDLIENGLNPQECPKFCLESISLPSEYETLTPIELLDREALIKRLKLLKDFGEFCFDDFHEVWSRPAKEGKTFDNLKLVMAKEVYFKLLAGEEMDISFDVKTFENMLDSFKEYQVKKTLKTTS